MGEKENKKLLRVCEKIYDIFKEENVTGAETLAILGMIEIEFTQRVLFKDLTDTLESVFR